VEVSRIAIGGTLSVVASAVCLPGTPGP
jgi:hypothetical protein